MSDWEQRLRNLAEGEAWYLPALYNVTTAMNQLRSLLDRVSSETGLVGTTDEAATISLQTVKASIDEQIRYLENDLPTAITNANNVRESAHRELAALGSGELSSEQRALIRGAAAGAVIPFGPFSIVAGEGAIALADWYMGNQRDDQARDAVARVSDEYDIARQSLPKPPRLDIRDGDDAPGEPSSPSTPSYPGGPGGTGGGPSFQQYPDFDMPPAGPPGGGPGGVVPTYPGPGGNGIFIPGGPGVLPGGPGIILNPDGPTDGGVPSLPGGPGVGTLPGGGSGGIGIGGSGGGGLGGGMTSGLVAGGAGAALGGLGKAAAGGGLGRLGGAGGLGGLGGAGGAGAGGLRAGGLGGGGLTANAGGAAGGLLGKGGTGVGAGAAGEAGGARGGTGMMGGGGGAPAGGGGRNEKKGRGLGGPVAPKLEDDADFGPRSENAGSGGRDE